jgi:hypothetical protein
LLDGGGRHLPRLPEFLFVVGALVNAVGWAGRVYATVLALAHYLHDVCHDAGTRRSAVFALRIVFVSTMLKSDQRAVQQAPRETFRSGKPLESLPFLDQL